MKRGTRSNSLLMEILLVVFFFLLSATVILNLFIAVHAKSEAAGRLTRAVTLAENLAEQLYGTQRAEDFLRKEQYTVGSESILTKTDQGLEIQVALSVDKRDAGVLNRAEISVWYDEGQVYLLPAAWYVPDTGEAA